MNCATLGSEDQQTLSLLKVTLAAYFAGAVMMPYDAFLESAKNLRYDLDLLARRFDTSLEQVCHRLTTLNAPHMRGIPFFFVRVDDAGNISKRLAAAGMQFATHMAAPAQNGRFIKRSARLKKYSLKLLNYQVGRNFSPRLARVPPLWSTTSESTTEFAVALVRITPRPGYYLRDHLDISKPKQLELIGIGCAACERMDCTQRAHPPIGHELRFDGHMRRVGLYDLDIN